MSGKQPIEHIPLVKPVPSLLTSAFPLSDQVNWRSGIAWTPLCGHASHAWARCPGGDALKEEAVTMTAPVGTDPFTIYTPIKCEWVTTEGGDKLTAMATDLTEVHTAAQIAAALWMGTGLTNDADTTYGAPPTLRRVATDVSIGGVGAGAAALDDVVAALLHAYTNCTGGMGGAVLHVPDILIPSALGGGDGGARVAWPEGDVYRGPLGSLVSPGPGYPHDSSSQGANGYGPLSSAGPPEVYRGNGYNEVWVYVSGPVEYAVTPIEPPNTDEERRTPFRMNTYEVIAERQAIVRFDPCCVFAARAVNAAGEVS